MMSTLRRFVDMMLKPEPACLVIADISGYTGFLAGAELDHAQDILADLMNTVVTNVRPTFRLAKLEGDAAFVYAITESIDGPLLQDTIERCYFAFQRRLRDIRQASSCECNACVLVPNLDLKFVAHHGQVIRQRIASSEELVGSDVIVAHRLLKNGVEEATGIGAYALYTDACLTAMGLTDPRAAGMVEHRETFDGVGEIGSWVVDLHAAWTAELARSRIVVEKQGALRVYETTLDASPAVVWEYVTSPTHRPKWQYGVEAVMKEAGPAGRRGIGTVNHCIHGKDAIIEEVLDWQPNDHVTYRSLLPGPSVPKLVNTFAFEDLGDGRTRMTATFGRPRSAKDRTIADGMGPMLDDVVERGLAALTALLAATTASAAGADAPAEPDLPPSRGRNVREPVGSIYNASGRSRLR
jgi:uncharacterized protein YndB with AHSA1/START domain